MDPAFEKMAAELEKEMWQEYSEATIDHVQHPRNMGSIEKADGFAHLTGSCGDSIKIWVKIEKESIAEIAFMTDGCGTSVAAGSMVTELAKGKTISEALEITGLDVLNALGGLPDDSVHCALLAANTLQESIKSYLTSQNTP